MDLKSIKKDQQKMELNELKNDLKTLEDLKTGFGKERFRNDFLSPFCFFSEPWLKNFDVAWTAQMTKLNHNCEVCARRASELYFKSSSIFTVAGTLLVVTVAYSLGWLSSAIFCCITWLLQLHSLSEMGTGLENFGSHSLH